MFYYIYSGMIHVLTLPKNNLFVVANSYGWPRFYNKNRNSVINEMILWLIKWENILSNILRNRTKEKSECLLRILREERRALMKENVIERYFFTDTGERRVVFFRNNRSEHTTKLFKRFSRYPEIFNPFFIQSCSP